MSEFQGHLLPRNLGATGGAGSVTSVTASSPLSSSGGATPDISLTGIVPIANGGTGQATPLDLNTIIGNTATNTVLTPLNSFLQFGSTGTTVTGNTFSIGVASGGIFTINTANSGVIHISAGGIDTITTGTFSPLTLTQSGVSGGTTASVLTATGGTITGWTATNKWDVKFDLSHSVTFANSVGDLLTQFAFIVTAPTYAYTSAAHTITAVGAHNVSGIPVQGANATFVVAAASLIGNIGYTGIASTSLSGEIVLMPGISAGFGSGSSTLSQLMAFGVPNLGNVSLGNTAATVTTLGVITLANLTFTSSAAVTVTNPATLYLAGPPSASGSVTFTNGPYVAFFDSGNFRLDGNILFTGNATLVSTDYSIVNNSANNNFVINAPTGRTIQTTINGVSSLNITSAAVLPQIRFSTQQGADVASPVSGDLTLGADGNVFTITGTNTINAITNTNWANGSQVILIFSGILTVKNNISGGAGTTTILLDGSADLLTAANTVIHLVKTTASWQQVSPAKAA